MSDDLHGVVRERLEADGLLQNPWSRLLFAALHGRDALASGLDDGATPGAASDVREPKVRAGAYLSSIAVQGFRGIGPKQTLSFTPGPGLTLIVGRNGSGKSSFAEALEVLVTGDSKRWSERSKIWKEGWRNLHQPHPASIEAEVLLEGQGPATIVGTWDADADLEHQQGHVQPKGKRKTTLQEIGWTHALGSHRPFLSYNELGSMLDEGPSKLYDALSLVLGLEDLVTAQDALGKARLERQRALDAVDQVRKELIAQLTELVAQESDDRASDCLNLLSSKSWGLDALEARLAAGSVPPENQDTNILTRVLTLETLEPERITAVASKLRDADAKLRAVAGTDAEVSRHQAALPRVVRTGYRDPQEGRRCGIAAPRRSLASHFQRNFGMDCARPCGACRGRAHPQRQSR